MRYLLAHDCPVDLNAYDRGLADGRRHRPRPPHRHAPERPDYERGFDDGCKVASNTVEGTRST